MAKVAPINSRAKGAGAEREFSRLIEQELGVPLVRNLEQSRNGGHDLTAPGDDPVSRALNAYAIEVKRYREITPALLDRFWQQAEAQARSAAKIPALAYREDRREWRVLVPLHRLNGDFGDWGGIAWTAEMTAQAFCELVRDSAKSPAPGLRGRTWSRSD
jgi:Holliday junction resolvase